MRYTWAKGGNNMKKWNIAAYLRLSSDDGDKAESNSIGNQRSIVKQYINSNKLCSSIKYYIDDGYSGTTFDRPDFKKMVDDIKNNKVNCIIVKDLSRLGRNYIEVGKYIDEIFPSYNIRFIAINDNIDTGKDPKSASSIIVPFKNLMNDEYARDISQKVRSVLDSKKGQGKFIGSYAPYGYLRDPKDKYKFIIDKEPAKIVKKIFSMILSGKSKKEIANELNSLQISTPRVYKLENGITHYNINDLTKLWNSKKLESLVIDFINNFRNVVIEIDQKIEQIVSQKEISYDIDIIKAKIDNIDNEINKFVKLRNEIKDDLKEKFITEAEYWEYSADYSKKISEYRKEKINLEDRLENISFESKNNEDWFNEIKKLKEVKKIDRLLIKELIEDIVIDENQNIKIIFKCEDKYFGALDFIKRQNYDIILSS